jgi:hypothetical protein
MQTNFPTTPAGGWWIWLIPAAFLIFAMWLIWYDGRHEPKWADELRQQREPPKPVDWQRQWSETANGQSDEW